MKEEEINNLIEEMFEENYQIEQVTSGSFLTDDIKRLALLEVKMYYKRLKEIAEKVTHTEVKLTLPDQKTESGRTFTIEGVVDIVKEDDDTWMYDIKTHDAVYINANKEFYENQLNVYAYIWQNLRKEKLHHTAVISTHIPNKLKEALHGTDESLKKHELEKWNPLIELPFKPEKVEETIKDFAGVVDSIEEKQFIPPGVEKLRTKFQGTSSTFGTFVCRNCDVRFSCRSFREFILGSGQTLKGNFQRYFDHFIVETEQEEWVNTHLDNQVFWSNTFYQLFDAE
jgi:hypothetical protein